MVGIPKHLEEEELKKVGVLDLGRGCHPFRRLSLG